jgi:hypothetical protein
MKHGAIFNPTCNHKGFNKSLTKNVQEYYPMFRNMSILKQGELVNVKCFTVLWMFITEKIYKKTCSLG